MSDTKQEQEWQSFKGHSHLRSWLSVPLVASDEYLGFLSVGHEDAQSGGDRQLSEEKFQKVLRSSPIPFSITTLKEGRFLDVNAEFERRYGYAREEVLGTLSTN